MIAAATTEEALELRHRMAPAVDEIEMRLDTLDRVDLAALLSHRPVPVLVTARPRWEGGHFRGTEAERIALLEEASRLGAEAVDVEHAAPTLPRLRSGTRLVLSSHDFERTPEDLARRLRDMRRREPSEVKIVPTVHTAADLVAVRSLLALGLGEPGAPLTCFGMGEEGIPSRILALAWGSHAVYLASGSGSRVAAGQLTVEEFRGLYRGDRLGKEAEVFGVVGSPVAHSLGPLLHNAHLARLERDAVYVPFLCRDLFDLAVQAPALGVRGLSVTIPHKRAAAELATLRDDESARCGAANTLLREPGSEGVQWSAFSFDGAAACGALAAGCGGAAGLRARLADSEVVIVGAGGTAAAIGHVLRSQGARGIVVNRGREAGEALARSLGFRFAPLEELAALRPGVLVHTTPVGMEPNVEACVVPESVLQPGCVVLDAVYRPLRTRLLALAARRGCTTVSGLEMFLRQAALQARRFTGEELDLDPARQLLLEAMNGGASPP